MTITIKLKTENAAFEGDRDEAIWRIIYEWASGPLYQFRPPGNCQLRDINGNTVGSVTVTGK